MHMSNWNTLPVKKIGTREPEIGKEMANHIHTVDAREGEIYTNNYADVDNSYENYERYRKQWYTSGCE